MMKTFVFILFIFYSCGPLESPLGLEMGSESQGFVTEENTWDGESWIGLGESSHHNLAPCWGKAFSFHGPLIQKHFLLEELEPKLQPGEKIRKKIVYARFDGFTQLNQMFHIVPFHSKELIAKKQNDFLNCAFNKEVGFEPLLKPHEKPAPFSHPKGHSLNSGGNPVQDADSPQNVLARIKADKAWALAANKDKRKAVVAVIDTGVDRLHPQLVTKIFKNETEANGKPGVDNDGNGWIYDVYGIDATIPKGEMDTSPGPIPGSADIGGAGARCMGNPALDAQAGRCGHGTHVAGIIAAEGNGTQPQGVCPNCIILPIRVTPQVISPTGGVVNGKVQDIAQIRALTYILDLVKPDGKTLITHIVNMSLGQYRYSRVLAWLLDLLNRAGVAVVAAAGNDDTETPAYPAGYPGVLSVCATGSGAYRSELAKAVYSNFGPHTALCAPGTSITSTAPGLDDLGGGAIATLSGTSQAAPFFSGAIGFLMGIQEGLMPLEAAQVLLQYANDDIYNDPYNSAYSRILTGGRKLGLLGSGFLDLEAALLKSRASGAYGWRQEETQWSGCVANSIGTPMAKVSPSLWVELVLGLLLMAKRNNGLRNWRQKISIVMRYLKINLK